MKGNKSLIVVLIIAVFGIWGAVGYQIFQAVNGSDPEVQNFTIPDYAANASATDEEVKLDLNYRDPFLTRRFAKRKRQSSAGVTTSTATAQNNTAIRRNREAIAQQQQKQQRMKNLPVVAYLGVLVNRDSKQEQAIVSVADKEFMLSEGDVFEQNFLLKSITLDSIIIEVEGEELVVSKTY